MGKATKDSSGWCVKDYRELTFPKSLHARQQNDDAARYFLWYPIWIGVPYHQQRNKKKTWLLLLLGAQGKKKKEEDAAVGIYRNRSKVTESELVSNSSYLNRIIVPNHPHSLKYPLHLFNDRLSLLFCYRVHPRPGLWRSYCWWVSHYVCNRSRSAASNRSRMTLLFIPVIPSQCICCYPSIVAHSPIMLFLSICCHCATLSNLLNLSTPEFNA